MHTSYDGINHIHYPSKEIPSARNPLGYGVFLIM